MYILMIATILLLNTTSASFHRVSSSGLLHNLRGGANSDGSFIPSLFETKPANTYKPSLSSSSATTRFSSSSYEVDSNASREVSASKLNNVFASFDNRRNFISKVYGILSAQLTFTAATIILFGTNNTMRKFAYFLRFNPQGLWVNGLSQLLAIVSMYSIILSPKLRRGTRSKWALLSAFTVFEAITVGSFTTMYDFNTVLRAMFATVVSTTSISAYVGLNKNQKYDLSQLGYFLFPATLTFLGLALFGNFSETFMASIGAGLMSCFIAFRTKTIIGGSVNGEEPQYLMDVDDYIFGAMALYNDIIGLFLYILRLIGENNKK